jgi:hypothetical protein
MQLLKSQHHSHLNSYYEKNIAPYCAGHIDHAGIPSR